MSHSVHIDKRARALFPTGALHLQSDAVFTNELIFKIGLDLSIDRGKIFSVCNWILEMGKQRGNATKTLKALKAMKTTQFGKITKKQRKKKVSSDLTG